ncbi:MAG TPA: hypothetical protein VFH61_03825 [Thermoleophilia bacterium]|nr:hypothetical protein [Thermoleophilia bacterium]
MPGEIYDASRTDASNNDATKGGWPEGMKRSDVNNRARENMGAVRRFYEDAEWTRLLEEQNGPSLTVSKVSNTSIKVASSPATDATTKFPAGARIRISVAGSSAVEAIIGVATYSSPDTTVPVTFPPIFKSSSPPGGSWSGLGTAASPASDTLVTFLPIVAGSLKVYDTTLHANALRLSDDGAGGLTHPVDGSVGTINYTTGAILVNGLTDAFDSDVTIEYQYTEVVPTSASRAEVFLTHSTGDAAHRLIGMQGGRLVLYEDFGGAAFKDDGPSSGLNADLLDGESAQDLVDRASVAGRNFVVNPSGKVAQRGTAITSATTYPNADAAYVLDRWLLLSEVDDDFNVNSLSSDGPDGVGACMELVATAANPASPSSDKGGLCQILTNEEAKLLAGQTVTLSFYAKISGTLDRIDAAVLTWGGTADTLGASRDLVSTWNAGGAEPTWTASWTRQGSILSSLSTYVTPNTTWQQYTIPAITIPAGIGNLGVFIWVDDNDFSTSNYLRVAGVQLEIGAVVQPYREPPLAEQQVVCQRFFLKNFPAGVAPVQNVGDNVGAIHAVQGHANNLGGWVWRFAAPMFKAPTVVSYNTIAADTNWDSTDSFVLEWSDAGSLGLTTGGSLTTGDAIHITAEAEL